MRKKIVISITSIVILLLITGLVVFYLFLPKENYQPTSETEGHIYNSQLEETPIGKTIDDIEDLKQNLYIAQKKYYEKKYANVEVKGKTDATQLGFGIKSEQFIDVKKIKNEDNQYLLMTSKGVLSSAFEVLITNKDEHKADYVLRNSSSVTFNKDNNFESATWGDFISVDRNEFIKNMFGHNFSSFTEYTLNDKSIKSITQLEATTSYNQYRVELHVGSKVEPEFVDASKRYAKEVKTQAGSSSLPNFEKVTLDIKLSKDWDVLEVVTNEIYKISKFGDVYTDTTLTAKFTYEEKQIPNYELFKPLIGTKTDKKLETLNPKEILIEAFGNLMLEYFNKLALDAHISLFGEEFDVKLQLALISDREVYFSIPKYNITGIYKNDKIYLDNNENHFSLEVEKLLVLKELFQTNKELIQEGGNFLETIKEKIFEDIKLEILENKNRKITVNLDGNIIKFEIDQNNDIKLIDADLNIGEQNKIKAIVKPSKEFIKINKINDSIYQDKTDLILNLVNIFKDQKILLDTNYIKLNDTYSIKVKSNIIYDQRLYTDTDVFIKNTNGTEIKLNIIQNGNNFYITYKDIKVNVSTDNLQSIFDFIKKIENLDFNLDFDLIDLESSIFENISLNKDIFFKSNIKEEIQNLDYSFINNLNVNLDDKSLVISLKEKEISLKNNKDYNLDIIKNITKDQYLTLDSYINNIEDIYNLFIEKKFDLKTRLLLDKNIFDLNLNIDLNNNFYNVIIKNLDKNENILNLIDIKYIQDTLYINFNNKLYKEVIDLDKAKKFITQFILFNKPNLPSDLLKTIKDLIFEINNDESINFDLTQLHKLLNNINIKYNQTNNEFILNLNNYELKLTKLESNLNDFDKNSYTEINLIDTIFSKLIFNLENKEKDVEKIYELLADKKYKITSNYININQDYSIKVIASINLDLNYYNIDLILKENQNNKEHNFNIILNKNSIYLTYNNIKVVFTKPLIKNIIDFIKNELNIDINFDINLLLNTNKKGLNTIDFDLSSINLDFIKKFITTYSNNSLNIEFNDYVFNLEKEKDLTKFELDLTNYTNINQYVKNISKIYDLILSKKYEVSLILKNENINIASKILLDLNKNYYHIDANIKANGVINKVVLTYNENILYIQINDRLYKEEIEFEKAYNYIKQFITLSASNTNNIDIFETIKNLNPRFENKSILLNLETLTNSFINELKVDYNIFTNSFLTIFDNFNIEVKKLTDYIIPNKENYQDIKILNTIIEKLNIEYNENDKLEYIKKLYNILIFKKYNIKTNDFIVINKDYSVKVNSDIILSDLIEQKSEIIIKDKNNKTITINLYSKGNEIYLSLNNLKVKTTKENLDNLFEQIKKVFKLDINFSLSQIPLVSSNTASKFDFDLTSINLDLIKNINIKNEDNKVIASLNDAYTIEVSNIEQITKPESLENYITIDKYITNFEKIYDLVLSKKYDVNLTYKDNNLSINGNLLLDLVNKNFNIEADITANDILNKVVLTYKENILYIQINEKFYKEEIEFEKAYGYIKQFIQLSNTTSNIDIFEYIKNINPRFENNNIKIDLEFLTDFVSNLSIDYNNELNSISTTLKNININVKKLEKDILVKENTYKDIKILSTIIDKLIINYENQDKIEFIKDLYTILSAKKYNIKTNDFIAINKDYSVKVNTNIQIIDKIIQETELVLKDKQENTLTFIIYSNGDDIYLEFNTLKLKTTKQNLDVLFTQIKKILKLDIDFELTQIPLANLNQTSKFDFDLSSIPLDIVKKLTISKQDSVISIGLNETYNIEISNINEVSEPIKLDTYTDISLYIQNFEKLYNLISKKLYTVEVETDISNKKVKITTNIDLNKNYYQVIVSVLNDDKTSLYQVEFRFIDNVLYANVNNKLVKEEISLDKFIQKFAPIFKKTTNQTEEETNVFINQLFDYIKQTKLTFKQNNSINLDLSFLSQYLEDILIKYNSQDNTINIEKFGFNILIKELTTNFTLTEEEKAKYETVTYINNLVDKIKLAQDLYLGNEYMDNLRQTISTIYNINLVYEKENIKFTIQGKAKLLPKVNLDLDIYVKYNSYVVNAKLQAKDNHFLLTANNLKFYLTFDEIIQIVKKLNQEYINNSINEDQLTFIKNVLEYILEINLKNSDLLIKLTNDLNIKLDLENHKLVINDSNETLKTELTPISEEFEVQLNKENALGYEQISKLFDIKDVVANVRKNQTNTFNINVDINKNGKEYKATGTIKSQRVSEDRIDIKLELNLTYEGTSYNVSLTMVENKVYFIINNLKLSFDKQDLSSSILTILKSINMNIPYLESILKSKALDIDTKFFEKIFEASETEILTYINSLTVENDTLYKINIKSDLISSIKDYGENFSLELLTENKNFKNFKVKDMYFDTNSKINLEMNANPDHSNITAPQDANTYKEVQHISKLVKALVKTASLKKYQIKGEIPVQFSGGLVMSSGTITFESKVKLDERNKPEFYIKAFVPYLGEYSKIGYLTAGKFNIEMYYKNGVLKVKDIFENKWYGPWDWYSKAVTTYHTHNDEYFSTDRTKKIMQLLHFSDRVIDSTSNSSSDYTRSNDFSKLVKDVKGENNQGTQYKLVLDAREVLASSGFRDLNMTLKLNEDDYIQSFDFSVDYNYLLADWVTLKGKVNFEKIGEDFEINMPTAERW